VQSPLGKAFDMACPHCRGEDTTQIEIRLAGEETVQFFSCRRCEAKWWERDGSTVALDEVLNLASEKGRK
jgi:hypothetical protein